MQRDTERERGWHVDTKCMQQILNLAMCDYSNDSTGGGAHCAYCAMCCGGDHMFPFISHGLLGSNLQRVTTTAHTVWTHCQLLISCAMLIIACIQLRIDSFTSSAVLVASASSILLQSTTQVGSQNCTTVSVCAVYLLSLDIFPALECSGHFTGKLHSINAKSNIKIKPRTHTSLCASFSLMSTASSNSPLSMDSSISSSRRLCQCQEHFGC